MKLQRISAKWVILTRMGPLLSLRYHEEPCTQEVVQSAELLSAGTHRIRFRVTRSLRAGMKVRLRGFHGSASAVITRSKAEREGFVITAQVLSGMVRLFNPKRAPAGFDPGILAVERFLSDEHFDRICAELDIATDVKTASL